MSVVHDKGEARQSLLNAAHLNLFDVGGFVDPSNADPKKVDVTPIPRFELEGAVLSFAGALAVVLTANATNYLHVTGAGALAISTVGFPAGTLGLWEVDVDAGGNITASRDKRILHRGRSTPMAHAAAHHAGGSDPLYFDSLARSAGDGTTHGAYTAAPHISQAQKDLIPTGDEKGALAGTSGAPNAANKYVTDADARNTNSRAPTAHAGSHEAGGADEVYFANLERSGGNATTHDNCTGAPHVTQELRDQIPAAGEKAALAGTSGAPGAGNKYVTDADARNTNSRAPTAHAGTHATGGSDPVSPASIGASAVGHTHGTGDVTGLDEGKVRARIGGVDVVQLKLKAGAKVALTEVPGENAIEIGVPGAAVDTHAATHATGGSDPVSPASIGASAVGHTHTVANITDSDEGQVRARIGGSDYVQKKIKAGSGIGIVEEAGNEAFRIEALGPGTLHASTHWTGGSDELTPADIGAAAAVHAATHATGGSDAVSPASIGAAEDDHLHFTDDISGLDEGRVRARIGAGPPYPVQNGIMPVAGIVMQEDLVNQVIQIGYDHNTSGVDEYKVRGIVNGQVMDKYSLIGIDGVTLGLDAPQTSLTISAKMRAVVGGQEKFRGKLIGLTGVTLSEDEGADAIGIAFDPDSSGIDEAKVRGVIGEDDIVRLKIAAGAGITFTDDPANNRFLIESTALGGGGGGGFRTLASELLIEPNPTFPLRQLDVAARAVGMEKADGTVAVAKNVAVTIDITTSGLGGLDTGAEAANTWYFVHVISDGTNVNGLLSLSRSAPTLPTGYVYRALVGAVRNNGSSDFIPFVQQGVSYRYEAPNDHTSVLAAGVLTTWTAVNLASFVPDGVRIVSILSQCKATNVVNQVFLRPQGAGGATGKQISNSSGADEKAPIVNEVSIPVSAPRQIEYRVSGSQLFLWVAGFEMRY